MERKHKRIQTFTNRLVFFELLIKTLKTMYCRLVVLIRSMLLHFLRWSATICAKSLKPSNRHPKMCQQAAVVQFRLFYEDYETFPIYPCFVGGDWRKSCQNFIIESISGISVANWVVAGVTSFSQNILHFPSVFSSHIWWGKVLSVYLSLLGVIASVWPHHLTPNTATLQ